MHDYLKTPKSNIINPKKISKNQEYQIIKRQSPTLTNMRALQLES